MNGYDASKLKYLHSCAMEAISSLSEMAEGDIDRLMAIYLKEAYELGMGTKKLGEEDD